MRKSKKQKIAESEKSKKHPLVSDKDRVLGIKFDKVFEDIGAVRGICVWLHPSGEGKVTTMTNYYKCDLFQNVFIASCRGRKTYPANKRSFYGGVQMTELEKKLDKAVELRHNLIEAEMNVKMKAGLFEDMMKSISADVGFATDAKEISLPDLMKKIYQAAKT